MVNYSYRPAPKARTVRAVVRAPSDYCWKVLHILTVQLSPHITESLRAELLDIVRRRDALAYSRLEDSHGLQSINRAGRPFPGNPGVVRLLCSVIRKHPAVETVSRKDRKSQCLEAVKQLDMNLLTTSPYWYGDPVFSTLRDILREILGPVPPPEVIAESARHGPGSSTTSGYKERNRYFKYQNWPYPVAPRAKDLLITVIRQDQRWVGVLEDAYRSKYDIPRWAILDRTVFWENIVHSDHCWNHVTTVPKDGAKDRPIAVEPAGNIFLQLGISGVIRSRLAAAGLNLNTQERNRRLCLQFSKEDSGYTIDLSNASDTISRSFCQAVLPPAWFELLDSVRSPWGSFPDGTYWRYAKMSSMGNATTFELESALFWGLQKAISHIYGHRSDRNQAFGDDLEGEGYLANHMYIYLQLSGFTPNKNKSFTSGPVRESCGVDAYEGEDIRPVFFKKQPATELDIYRDRNRLNRWFFRTFGTSNPLPLDNFFSKFLSEWLPGPESDNEFDGYWHVDDFPLIWFKSLTAGTTQIPARDFGFRKLMHDLRGSSIGGRFIVSSDEDEARTIKMIPRAPSEGGYSTNGNPQNHPKPPYAL